MNRLTMRCCQAAVVVCAAALAGWSLAWADEPASAKLAAREPGAHDPAQGIVTASPRTTQPYERHWYFAFGGSNYHPRLKESEAKVDRQLNDLLGWLPFWDEPTTFKDWADRFMLWDVTVGVGRDITPRTSWMVWTGGAAATIKNDKRYGPLKTDIQFSRATAFLTLQGYWYPWDKVDYAAVAEIPGLARVPASFRNAKPYLALATGYSFVRCGADAKFKLPLVGTVMRQKEDYDHHLYQVSPRLGIELPVSKSNSITAEGMYYFFGPKHSSEYNGPSMFLGFKHRF